jgi:hypothetical protein
LDERWEAIEQAERLYRDTRKRVSTDQIGLARMRDGTSLVRIGEPQRPEFAAWRYGDQFGRRRTRQALVAGGGIAAVAGIYIGGAVAGIGIGGFIGGGTSIINVLVNGRSNTVVAKIRTEEHGLIHVRRRHLGESMIGREADGSLALNLRFKNGEGRFIGREAERIAAIVMPKVNRFGGSKAHVGDAVSTIENHGSSEKFLRHLGDVARVYTKSNPRKRRSRWASETQFSKYGLYSLPRAYRLAAEMALHEEAERRAMEGELQELERAWREAEEIAGIADNLLVPESVDEQFRKLKDGK